MKRTIGYYLQEWKERDTRKPLLVRGARQVGKTYVIRQFGSLFSNFVEINLEANEAARTIIEKDLDPKRIIRQLSELLQTDITPGSTLLFFDEIQVVPKAILALRYFYEIIPALHVVAAGSLLDFAIEQVGIPVGRISTLYMYPVSFLEFLVATGNTRWAELILDHTTDEPLSEPVHEGLLAMVGEYLAIGGMPEAVNEWIKTGTSRATRIVHADLVYTYQQDFGKYAKKHQIKYLDLLFQKAVDQLANKFMYARVGEYKKRELEPSLELLEKAGLFYRVIKSAGQGLPIGSQADLDDFKILFLDVGLSQAILKLAITFWFIDPLNAFVNKGELVEAFIGQELLAYSDPIMKESLFYWRRDSRGSHAEIDYMVQLRDSIVPIKVKAGASKRIKSMQIFLESHPGSSYGIRFSTDNYAVRQHIVSYPLYATAKPCADAAEGVSKALRYLVTR